VDGIERNLAGRADVLRLNVTDSVGSQIAVRYAVRRVPTLVLLSGSGDVVLRQSGRLRGQDMLNAVDELTG